MSVITRIRFRKPEDLKIAIHKICDYLENVDTEVHISNHYRMGLDSDIGFNKILNIDDLRNMEEILGFVDIEGGEYSISMSNVSMSYFKCLL